MMAIFLKKKKKKKKPKSLLSLSLVLTPISTDGIDGDPVSVEKLANECRSKMLQFLWESYENKKMD
jgi:hypothetical protein